MKKLTLILTLLTSLTTLGSVPGQSQIGEINLRFWDGTFAYNQLLVNAPSLQSNFLVLKVSGGQINLGGQLEGSAPIWSSNDLFEVSLSKKDCQLDLDQKILDCEKKQTYVSNLRWEVNEKISKTYTGLIHNLKISASDSGVNVSFSVPSDEHFSPANEDISISFPVARF